MSEIERIIDSLDRKALADAMTDPIKTSLSYGAIGRKLLLVDELPQDKMYKLIDFVSFKLKTLCDNEKFSEETLDSLTHYLPVAYYLEDNFNEIFNSGLNVYYIAKMDFKSHLKYLYDTHSLENFLGEYYTNCERIYNLSKIYVNEE